MPRTILGRVFWWTTLTLLVVAFGSFEPPQTLAQGTMKKMTKRARRLPTHYATVVTAEQREKIYKIQEEYAPKIAELVKQIEALKAERDQKIKAVLTPEQAKQVEAAREARKATKKAAPKPNNSRSTDEPKESKSKEPQ